MPRFRLFACEVLFREVCIEAANSPNVIDLSFNRFGLHHVGCSRMAGELQDLIDSAEGQNYDAVLMGYGLCSNGVVGLKSRSIPVVIPRGHDCITLLLGSKEKYDEVFKKEPGTYYHSPGWCEHHNLTDEENRYEQMGMTKSLEELIEKYGEDNAEYLMETLGNMGGEKNSYKRLVYIDTKVGPNETLIEKSRQEAVEKSWNFEVLEGDRGLIRRLVNSEWNPSEFLVLQPGQVVRPTYDATIIKAQ